MESTGLLNSVVSATSRRLSTLQNRHQRTAIEGSHSELGEIKGPGRRENQRLNVAEIRKLASDLFIVPYGVFDQVTERAKARITRDPIRKEDRLPFAVGKCDVWV
jgi:hypothetical protein